MNYIKQKIIECEYLITETIHDENDMTTFEVLPMSSVYCNGKIYDFSVFKSTISVNEISIECNNGDFRMGEKIAINGIDYKIISITNNLDGTKIYYIEDKEMIPEGKNSKFDAEIICITRINELNSQNTQVRKAREKTFFEKLFG